MFASGKPGVKVFSERECKEKGPNLTAYLPRYGQKSVAGRAQQGWEALVLLCCPLGLLQVCGSLDLRRQIGEIPELLGWAEWQSF